MRLPSPHFVPTKRLHAPNFGVEKTACPSSVKTKSNDSNRFGRGGFEPLSETLAPDRAFRQCPGRRSRLGIMTNDSAAARLVRQSQTSYDRLDPDHLSPDDRFLTRMINGSHEA